MNNGIFRPQLMKLGMVKGQVFCLRLRACAVAAKPFNPF
jgi:hypothetical protein